MSKKALSDLLQRWVNRTSRVNATRAVAKDRHRARPRLEEVEDRAVPATDPTAQVIDTRPVVEGYQPQAAIDPLNPNNLVVVNIADGAAGITYLTAAISTDGGTSYRTFFDTNQVLNPPNPLPAWFQQQDFRLADPSIDPGVGFAVNRDNRKFTNTSSPAVTWGRDGLIYVTALEHNADKSSGAVVVYSFDATPAAMAANTKVPLAPAIRDLDPNNDYDTGDKSPSAGQGPTFSNDAAVLYRWVNQEPAYNPTIAVDNTLPVYTDPETGRTSTVDTMTSPISGASKAVYVAWNTDSVQANQPGHSSTWNPNVILTAASSDTGFSFTNPEIVNDGGYVTSPQNPGFGAVSPQILFTPGNTRDPADPASPPDAPGRLTFTWTSTQGRIGVDSSQPDGGLAGLPVSASSGHVRVNPGTFIVDGKTTTGSSIDTPGRTDIPLSVDLVNGGGGNLAGTDTLTDLNVGLGIIHGHDSQLEVILTAPDGRWLVLLDHRDDQQGNLDRRPSPWGGGFAGLPDVAHLGSIQFGALTRPATYVAPLTVFDDEASKRINDTANVPTYSYPVQPEDNGSFGLPIFAPAGDPRAMSGAHVASLRDLYQNRTASQLSGNWILTVFDVKNSGTPPPGYVQEVQSVDFQASAYISNPAPASSLFPSEASATPRFGGDTQAFDKILPGGADQTYPTKVPASPTLGIGPSASFAYDTSVGSYSPFSGRLYVAYTAMSALGSGLADSNPNPNVFVRYSDDNGASWSAAVQVNDDNVADNFSEGRRTQFQPSIAVDPTTGTVVVTWYDARNDAANTRLATYIATSIDGGNTFSTHPGDVAPSSYNTDVVGNQTWLNSTKKAIDAVTGQTVTLEPIPGNILLAGPNGFGVRQALIVYGGEVHPFWSGNNPFKNQLGQLESNNGNGNTVYTNTVHVAAGPRIISSDMGPVTAPTTVQQTVSDSFGNLISSNFITYNASPSADGTWQLDGFTVQFDRQVNVSTFTTADVQVFYRGVATQLGIAATQIPVISVTPLDLIQSGFDPVVADTATRFLVRFAAQSAVGTYSYQIGPDIRDRVRSATTATFGSRDTPRAITDFVKTTSSVLVNGIPGTVQKLRVGVNIAHTFDEDLRISLVGPDGTSIILSNQNGVDVNGKVGGDNYTNTIFDDDAGLAIGSFDAFTGPGNPPDYAPFTGAFIPNQLLSTFNGKAISGTWKLVVEDLAGGNIGNLLGWSITFLDAAGNPISISSDGNKMDQDADGESGETVATATGATDIYSVPASQSGVPFTLPYDTLTQPLVIPGPRMTGSSMPGFNESQDITVLGTAGTFKVTFDTGSGPQSTGNLAFNVPATGGTGPLASLQNALAALPNVGAGNVLVTATPVPASPTSAGGTIYHVTFVNALGYTNLPLLTAAGAGGATPTVTPTVDGLAQMSPSSDNLVLNSGTGAIDVYFDRDIDPTSFNVGNVLRITGPTGAIEEQQDITVLGTSGTFLVTFNDGITSATTFAVPFNVPASGGTQPTDSLQNALAALPNVGAGNVVVTSTPTGGGTIYHVFFINNLAYHGLPAISAAGSGGATASALKLYSVRPEAWSLNPTTGGYRVFRISFPSQVANGAYSVDIGYDKAGNYLRAVDQPRLITNLPASTGSVTVTFDGNTSRVPTAADVLRITGPNGTFNPGTITVTPTGNPREYRFQFSNPVPATGQYVVEFTSDLLVKPGTNSNLNVAGKIDTNQNAGLNTLGMVGTATGVSQQKTYPTALAANVTIPALGTADLPLTVNDDYLIQQILSPTPSLVKDIRVTLNVLFPNDPDLTGELIAPDGTTVLLFDSPGVQGQPNQANFSNTVLTDAAATPILSARPPFNAASGALNPQLPFGASLNGKGSKGIWTLRITNHGSQVGSIQNWSLTLPSVVAGTGLGEPNADKVSLGFRIFTQDPSNALTQKEWTPVGPASENTGANSGRIGGLAVDPSDPSGNTVYVGGASGGVWKTTNFLTQDPDGPQWVPLTDYGKTFSLNIGGIAVFPRNNDTNQSIIVAATGEGDTGGGFNTGGSGAAGVSTPGVGFLISQDGGKTWNVYDSTKNVDDNGNVLAIDSPLRDHKFVGTVSFKVVVDPTLNPSGDVIIYAALSDTVPGRNNGGIWRSNDTGRTWTQVRAGQATDVVLAAGSAPSLFDPSDPTLDKNLEIMYAGFAGDGVYFSPQAPSATSMDLLAGGNGNQLFRNFDIQPSQPEIPINNPTGSPNGGNITRISLATPFQTNDPIQNVAYSGWLYALVSTSGGPAGGLFMTKDFGRNWVKVKLSEYPLGSAANPIGYGTNDVSRSDHSLFGGGQFDQGAYDQAIAIDPNNPNIVYLGGTNDGTRQPLGGFVRVDVTGVEDSQAMVAYNNELPDNGTAHFTRDTGSVVIETVPPAPAQTGGPGGLYGLKLPHNVPRTDTGYLNLFRDPLDPFNSNATLYMTNVERFQNRGYGALYAHFTAEVESDVHRIITFVDPLTHKARLIVGDDHGVASVVDQEDQVTDNANGVHNYGIGFADQPSQLRNGNLQIVQFYYGAVQPSQLAADIAGAMFYGNAQDDGYPVSQGDILTTGSTQDWTGVTGDGSGVATDQTGSGTSYSFRWPCCGGNSTDFFLVDAPPHDRPFPDDGGVSRTNGLLQAGDNPFAQQGQWPYIGGANFTVNPIDKNGIIVSAPGTAGGINGHGRVFRTTNQGVNWFAIGEPNLGFGAPGQTGPGLDNTWAGALAFGAPDPGRPGVSNDFIYAGTSGGRVFVTRTGTAPWLNISAALNGSGGLDGSAIQSISADPKRGSTDLFVVTLKGVYYKADAFDTSTGWVNITGNLFGLEKSVLPNLGNPADPGQTLQYLTSIAADWRYAIPVDPTNAQTATFPVLYVGGEGGVFRSIDFGQNWNYFPAGGTYVDPNTGVSYDVPDGGYLPNAHVTDLDLSLGNIDPSSGLPVQGQQGLDLLLATTYGRGSFAIRLGDVLPQYNVLFQSGPRVSQLINPNPVGGPSTAINVQFTGTTVATGTFTASDVHLSNAVTGATIPVTSVAPLALSNIPSPNTFQFIPDGGSVTSPIPVSVGPGTVQRLRVQANISHPADGDLRLILIAPNGTQVVLSDQNGGTGFNYTNTVFDDFATNSITTGTAPFTGTFRPQQPLSVLNGLPISGTWQLLVQDVNANFEEGFLQGWSISFLDAAGNPIGQNLFQIQFAPISGPVGVNVVVGYNPTGDGNYPADTPLITDTAGNLMNQDGDGLNPDGTPNPNITVGAVKANGEPVLDQYRTTIQLNGTTNNRLVVTSSPATATAGTPVQVRIEAHDTNDQVITTLSGTLNFTPAPGTGTFSPTTVQMTNGVATFPVTYQKAGAETINAAFSGPSPLNGTAWTTTVTAGAATQLAIVPASSVVTAPATQSFDVFAEDQFGNVVTTYTDAVTLTSAGVPADLPSDPTVVMTNGHGTFTAGFNTRGTVTITATGPNPVPGGNDLTGTATVLVSPGPATHLVASAPAGPFSTGTQVPVTVQALDDLGNLAANLDGQAVAVTVSPGGTSTAFPAVPVFVNGVASFTVTFNADGTYTVTGTDGGLSATTGPISISPSPPVVPPPPLLTGTFAVGTGMGGSPVVSVYTANGAPLTSFTPFPPGFNNEVDPASAGFTGGNRVAVGDVTGDGVPDYVVGTGPTITASVRVFDGATGQVVLDYQPFDAFQGGVFVAVGDIDKDKVNEIVITPDRGGGPRVVILEGKTFDRVANFFGINDPNFRGGARASLGDVNGDGAADLVVSAGFGGGPRIAVFDGAALTRNQQVHLIPDFFMFEPTLRNGAYVAVGDVNGDGFGDIIGGAGPGGGPRVLVISGDTTLRQGPAAAIANPVANFFAGNPDNRGGVPVTAKNLDGDPDADVMTGTGEGGGSTVSAYRGADLVTGLQDPLFQFDALPGYLGGVFVG